MVHPMKFLASVGLAQARPNQELVIVKETLEETLNNNSDSWYYAIH